MSLLNKNVKQFIKTGVFERLSFSISLLFIIDSSLATVSIPFEYYGYTCLLIFSINLVMFLKNKKEINPSEVAHNDTSQQQASTLESDLESIIEESPTESLPFILNLDQHNPVTFILPELPSLRSQIVVPQELHHFVESFLFAAQDKDVKVKTLKSHNLNFIKQHQKKLNPTPFQIIETRDSDNENIFNLN